MLRNDEKLSIISDKLFDPSYKENKKKRTEMFYRAMYTPENKHLLLKHSPTLERRFYS
ncbi:hypothetical protein PP707_00865 [Acetobacter pasteurianus]|nr:hypothetical protein [Acetobacter pasteurianus]